MKILDTGNLESRMVADASADAVVISGLAPTSTLEKTLAEGRKVGIYSVVDMLNVRNPVKVIEKLKVKPDIVELHRDIDTEDTVQAWGDAAIKKAAGGKLLVATAGGVRVNVVKDALNAGADILVVGRAITASKDFKHSADEFLDKLEKEESDSMPDFVIRYKPNNDRFAIECKWRANFFFSQNIRDYVIRWAEPYQIKNYQQYSKKMKIPVFVVIGLSGEPSHPKYIFCIPLEEAKYPEIFHSVFDKYERESPNKPFYWDTKNKNLL